MVKGNTQQKIVPYPVDLKTAERIAQDVILEQIGSVPTIGKVSERDNAFVVDIDVSFPRVIMDDTTGQPRKTRFLNVGKVGEIVIDMNNGRIIDRPRYFDVQQAIRNKLDFVNESVEKALVRVAANNFSVLPFAVHLHTPVLDVISWLLVNDFLRLEDISELSDESAGKLLSAIQPLEKVNLVEVQGDRIVPGSILIGIEGKYDKTDEQLAKAIAHFFKEGYTFIESIRQVLGPHLALSNIIYGKAVEYDSLMLLDYKQIEREFLRKQVGKQKAMKIPRYLVQLESIGVLEKEFKGGRQLWKGEQSIFDQVCQEEIIEPVQELMT